MNLNFKLGRLSRRTLLSMSRAIAPIEIGVKHLDEEVVHHIEHQLRRFPVLHRVGFIMGLFFVEWAAPLGGWGVTPLSLLSRERATRRLYKLLHSRFTPVRLFVNGARVLICLAAYGDPRVEAYFGFHRRAWRSQRIKTRRALLNRDGIADGSEDRVVDYTHIPPTPETLYSPSDQERVPLLSWDAHERVRHDRDDDERFVMGTGSPFNVEDFIDHQRPGLNDDLSDEEMRAVYPEHTRNIEHSASVDEVDSGFMRGDQNV